MERIINVLVEYDKKGQQIVQLAEDQRREVIEHMSDYKKELADQYQLRSDNRIDLVRQQAESEAQEQIDAARKLFLDKKQQLKETFEKNNKQWVDEMVRRCIGG